MAISMTVTTESGIIVENAYGKITTVGGGKDGGVIELKFYKDKQSSVKLEPVMQKTELFTPAVYDGAENFIKQGYQHLKKLSFYAESVDILD